MKNICFFNTTNFWGGGEKLHLEYALKFRSLGYHVIIACKEHSPLYRQAEQHDFETHHFEVGNLSFLNRGAVKKVKEFYLHQKIDTVFFITSQDMKIGAIAGHKAGVKRRVYLRGLAVPIKNSRINRKCLSTYLTHVIANSGETKDLICKNFTDQIIREKVAVIYHGIDLDQFDKDREEQPLTYHKEPGEFVIGNAGRLTEQKGQNYLIQMAGILKQRGLRFKLIIAGTGELESELKMEIEAHGLQDEVKLLGFVKDMVGFMNSIDVFALSSLWEGFGFVIVEAMACHKPVVAFSRSSNPEIIADEQTGYLINELNIEAFANCLQLLMENDELRSRMSDAARQSVEGRFQLDDRVKELEQYLLRP